MKTLHDRLLDELTALFLETGADILAGRIEATPQERLGPAQPYRTRLDSERVADLLPMGWDTPLSIVRAIGRDLMETRTFWSAYEFG